MDGMDQKDHGFTVVWLIIPVHVIQTVHRVHPLALKRRPVEPTGQSQAGPEQGRGIGGPHGKPGQRPAIVGVTWSRLMGIKHKAQPVPSPGRRLLGPVVKGVWASIRIRHRSNLSVVQPQFELSASTGQFQVQLALSQARQPTMALGMGPN